MMKFLFPVTLLLSFFYAAKAQNGDPFASRAKEILSQMTTEEKVGQMTQITLDVVLKEYASGGRYPASVDAGKLNDALIDHHIGSVFNITSDKPVNIQKWNELTNSMQRLILQRSRLKIPILYGIDGMHGNNTDVNATLFPHQIGQAATWNTKLVEDAAGVSAYELRAAGINWNFAPVQDLGVEPRWARFYETFGEDPFVASAMGSAVVSGFQGKGHYMGKYGVISCAKHFLGYSAPKSGKDRTLGLIPENYLLEYHVPPFKATFDAGAYTVMINSSNINGMPTALNGAVVNDLLKKKLQFRGFAVTDWQNVENIYNYDKVAESYKEAIRIAINAGIDMFMVPWDYRNFQKLVLELISEKKVEMARIDDAVLRILKVKLASGAFENPLTDYKKYKQIYSAQHRKVAYDLALESITLLKNEGKVLPLAKASKILVTGPNASSMRALNGGWTYSWSGFNADEYAGEKNTILEAVQNEFGKANVGYAESVVYKQQGTYHEDSVVSLSNMVREAEQADILLVCIGENSYAETAGNLSGNLELSANQTTLVKTAVSTGKPVVLVLNEGRPRTIASALLKDIKGVIDIYLPGNYGGDALAAILSGRVCPSGKLPFTYPADPEYTAPYYHKVSQEAKGDDGRYYGGRDFLPAWEFGHGLSYTTFTYSGLKTDRTDYQVSDSVRVSVDVSNTGGIRGKEAVLCFVNDVRGNTLSPDVKRLREFTKVELNPGETKTVTFKVAVSDLGFYNYRSEKIVEQGLFTVSVGNNEVSIRVNETQILERNGQ